MGEQNETKFKQRVLKDLKTLPHCWVLKTQERSRRGIPDLLICLRGHFFGIELKSEGKKPDALQEHTLASIRAAQGRAYWTTPSAWPLAFAYLEVIAWQGAKRPLQ